MKVEETKENPNDDISFTKAARKTVQKYVTSNDLGTLTDNEFKQIEKEVICTV